MSPPNQQNKYWLDLLHNGAEALPVVTESGAALTLTSAHAGRYVRCTHATPTVAVAKDATQPMPQAAEITLEASGGTITVAAASGVTINSPGGSLASSAQYGVLTLKHTALDTWTLMGALA